MFLTLLVCTLGNVRSALELSEEEWNQIVKTNLTGAWLVSKYVCIRMRDAERGGSIINISSVAGLNRGYLPGATAYTSSKAGLNALTKVMSFDLQFFENMEALSLTYFIIIFWKQNG
jgi:NAD(P)-dependent dehydrogenase (short-subunit alcohol dehydrogenase family)